jgi:macrodomain Ter protein organizer (MatP/YcbG family)
MRASDKGFNIVAGRPRHKPWEQKASVVIRLEQETYQRIRRLADKRKCSVSQAVELLIRTQDSERIEPTLPVDYSHILNKGGSYTVSQLLNLPR